MADQIMSFERIRTSAEHAAQQAGTAGCPPEFHPYRDIWLAEYRRAVINAEREVSHG